MYLENNQVKHYPLKIFLTWFLVILWMALIFIMSHQTQETTDAMSQGTAETVLSIFNPGYDDAALSEATQIIQNIGHAFLYLILAMLVSWAFGSLNIVDFKNALLAFLVCALYAASDEWHQAFVPGRISQFSDFLIDLTGIAAGIFLYQAAGIYRYFSSDLQVDRDESLRI